MMPTRADAASVSNCPLPSPRPEEEELTVELGSWGEVECATASTAASDEEELIIDLGDVSEPSVQRTGAGYADSSVTELREQCRRHSLRARGTKEELVHRLAEALG